MYLTKGKLNTPLLCLFTASDGYASSGLKPECAWRDGAGVVRVGTWLGSWAQVERAWGLDTYGQWVGAPIPLLQATGLKVLHASGATIVPVREGTDLVYHVESGENFRLDWLRQTVTAFQGIRDGSNALYSIYNATTGSRVRVGNSPQLPLAQVFLPDGSYVVHVQYVGVIEGLRLPPDYERDSVYNYQTEDGRLSHFNPIDFVGEVPIDPEHDLNVWRRELLASNLQQDNPEYAKYVTYEGAVSGEASAVKLQIGGGTWAAGAGIIPIPSRALHELDFTAPDTLPEGESPSTPVPISFDPLAHVISQALHTRPDGVWGGKVLLGGARLTADGPKPSLWQWNDDGTATLLGTATSSCEPICEQLLSTGLVTGLSELQDGSIIMLTLCSRHRYDATGSESEMRLPRYPASVDGEPGGRAMVTLGDGIGTRVLHTTEAFDMQPDPATPSFYNVTVDVTNNEIRYAPGTLAHVDGCLWRHRGKVMGVRCDGEPADPATRSYITSYDGIWRKGTSPWRASWLFLQRGASINGINLCFGYVPNTETARVVRDNGRVTQVLACDYRLRSGTMTNHETSASLQTYLAPGRKVLDTELQSGWCLVEMDGSHDGDGGDDDLPGDDPLDPPGEEDELFYRVLQVPAVQPIHVLQVRDALASQALRLANADLNENTIGVRLRVDSNAPIDDFASYNWRPRLDRGFAFPVAAFSKVEVLIVTRAALAPEQLPLLGVEA